MSINLINTAEAIFVEAKEERSQLYGRYSDDTYMDSRRIDMGEKEIANTLYKAILPLIEKTFDSQEDQQRVEKLIEYMTTQYAHCEVVQQLMQRLNLSN